jgi:hypothetical protein
MTAAERRLKERLASFFVDRAQHVSRQISAHLGHEKAGRISKDDADYVQHPVAGEMCADCSMFRSPNRCTLVVGAISRQGHCRYFEPPTVFDVTPALSKGSDHDASKVGTQAYGTTVAGSPGGVQRVASADRDARLLASKGSDHPDLHVKPENAEPIGLPVADVVTRANVQHVAWELVREGKNKTKRRILPIDDLIAMQQVVDKKRVAKHEKMLAETGELEKEGAILVLEWDGDLFMLGGHHGTQAAKNLGWTEVPADVMNA